MRVYLVHKLSARTTALLPLLMERLLNRWNPIAVPRQPSSVSARELQSCDRHYRRPYARPFSDGTGHKIEREAERNSRSLVTRNVAGDRFLTRDQDRLLNRTAMATSTCNPVGIPSGRDFSCASPRPRRYLRYCRVLRGGPGYPPIHPESDRWWVRCCTSSTVPGRQGFRRSAAGSCPG